MASSDRSKKYQQELTCYGYVRRIEPKLHDKIIPDNIIELCFQYYLYVKYIFTCIKYVKGILHYNITGWVCVCE